MSKFTYSDEQLSRGGHNYIVYVAPHVSGNVSDEISSNKLKRNDASTTAVWAGSSTPTNWATSDDWGRIGICDAEPEISTEPADTQATNTGRVYTISENVILANIRILEATKSNYERLRLLCKNADTDSLVDVLFYDENDPANSIALDGIRLNVTYNAKGNSINAIVLQATTKVPDADNIFKIVNVGA